MTRCTFKGASQQFLWDNKFRVLQVQSFDCIGRWKIGLFELYNKFHPSQLYFVLLELPKEEAEKRLIERGDTKDIKQRMKDFELSDERASF